MFGSIAKEAVGKRKKPSTGERPSKAEKPKKEKKPSAEDEPEDGDYEEDEDANNGLQYCLIFILYFLCFLCELLGLIIAMNQFNSNCLQGYEISSSVLTFVLLIAPPIVPDFVIIFMGMCLTSLYTAPFSVGYNVLIALPIFVGSAIGMVSLNYCGNSAQNYLTGAYSLGFAAGSLHIVLGVFIHCIIPDGDWYGKTSR